MNSWEITYPSMEERSIYPNTSKNNIPKTYKNVYVYVLVCVEARKEIKE